MKNAIENQSLDFFEPIGSNCEFGFVLRRFGSERPGLFRWNGITPAHFRYLLDQKFEGAFELENLNALPPKMIMDSKYKWVFHSAIESDENKNFLHSEADLRKLHRIEKAKVFNDIALFHGRLARGGIVCVLLVEAMAQSEMIETLASIDGYAGNQSNMLLVVTEPGDSKLRPGELQHVGSRIQQGIVERMAPHGRADDADYESWKKILDCVGL